MNTHALRLPLEDLTGGELTLPPDEAHYLVRVHRLSVGDRFIAFDPAEQVEAQGVVIAAPARGPVRVRLETPRPARLRPGRRVTLVQAIAKDDKFAAVVRDSTELGATTVVAAVTERTIKRPRDQARWLARLRRVAVQAARQCGRGDVPEIKGPWPLERALSRVAGDHGQHAAWCLEPSAQTPLRQALGQLSAELPLVIAVGPEGGWTSAELDLCSEYEYLPLSFGSLVLRTETVCAAVLGAVLALG